MSNYDICYLDSNRKLIDQISTECSDDRSAAAFAYAMSSQRAVRLEIWSGDTLICEGATTAIRANEKPLPIAAFQLRRSLPPRSLIKGAGTVRPRAAAGR
jgi:hypothetical protein